MWASLTSPHHTLRSLFTRIPSQEQEAILPLGEVSMDGSEVMEVGTILSLVETDGTIVIQGTAGMPPLAEGSVLTAIAKVRQEIPSSL